MAHVEASGGAAYLPEQRQQSSVTTANGRVTSLNAARHVAATSEQGTQGQRVRVFVRPRPVTANETSALIGSTINHNSETDQRASIALEPTENCVKVNVRRDPRHANGKADAGEDNWSFKFDGVFSAEASQEEIFQRCVPSLLGDLLSGYNGTILAYGQTGAGKTHTMMGNSGNPSMRGLAARTISKLFRDIDQTDAVSFTVRMSYLEIYKEQFYDLLASGSHEDEESKRPHTTAAGPSSKRAIGGSFQFATHPSEGITLLGLSRKIVRNEEDALACLFEGETNRAIASHELNYSSTRSHCIVTFWVEKRASEPDPESGIIQERVSSAKLHLVDLAGSERVLKTNSVGSVLQEAKAINKSLSFLEQVVVALGDKKRDHVPYRQSLLTHFLQDSLGGNCKSLLIACVWPAVSHAEQTIATLKFATRMMRVKNIPVRNKSSDVAPEILNDYKKEIRLLREELALRDAFFARHMNPQDYQQHTAQGLVVDQTSGNEVLESSTSFGHTPFSAAVRTHLQSDIQNYLSHGDPSLLGVQSLRHVYTLLDLMREMTLKAKQSGQLEASNLMPRNQHQLYGFPETESKIAHGKLVQLGGMHSKIDNLTESVDSTPHPPASSGPRSSRPRPGPRRRSRGRVHNHIVADSQFDFQVNNNDIDNDKVDSPKPEALTNKTNGFPEGREEHDYHTEVVKTIDREKLFLQFKLDAHHGAPLYSAVEDAKKSLVQLKAESKKARLKVNEAKARLDSILQTVQAQDLPAPELVDELRMEKGAYRSATECLKEIKSEIAYATQVLKSCRERMATTFESWLQDTTS